MQLDRELAIYSPAKDSIITIGVFDGVHIGHRYLVSHLKKLASEANLASIAITFRQHPQQILNPDYQPPFLTDPEEKAELLKAEGIDIVIVLDFTRDLARMGAREFLEVLQNRLRMRGLVVGPDFSLGKDNEGNITTLKKLSQEMNFSLTVIPPVVKNGEIISSTAIRRSLAEGDMEKVHNMLGRPFSLHGKVVHGRGRGASLGFPTVNLNISPGQAIPSDGVYASLACVKNQIFDSVTNVGKNPTFGENERTVESYLLDYQDDLYEHKVRIDFIKKIRDEIKFNNPAELRNQISIDIKFARKILADIEKPEHCRIKRSSSTSPI